MSTFETILNEKIQTLAVETKFETNNLNVQEDVTADGEIMVMKIHGQIPSVRSAIANLARHAEKFICHFEVWTDRDLYIAEAISTNIKSCIQQVERKMLQKLGVSTPITSHPALF